MEIATYKSNLVKILMYFFFFLSGITGLVYEVVWGKYLSLFMGSTAYAHVVVLATFMAGLSFGNYYIGKYSDKFTDNPSKHIRLYAYLEIGIGIYSLVFLILVTIFSSLYVAIAKNFSLNSIMIYVMKFIFSTILIIFPTFLMGGTLPVLTKYFVSNFTDISLDKGRIISNLYFLNSFGAVVGGLLSGFYLIPNLGLFGTVITGFFINLIIGSSVLGLDNYLKSNSEKDKEENKNIESIDENNENNIMQKTETYNGFNNLKNKETITNLEDLPSVKKHNDKIIKIALISIAFSGFSSFLYELVWIRMLSSVIGSSTYSFTLMLASFISGIALGSWIIHSKIDKVKKPLLLFGILELVLSVVLILTLISYERLPYYFLVLKTSLVKTEIAYSIYEFFKMSICILFMIIPTTIIGMTLPLIANFLSDKYQTIGKDIGKVFSINTLGCVGGAIITGLVLIPILGTRITFEIGILINLAIGFVTISLYLNQINKVTLSVCLIIFVIITKIASGGEWSKHIKIGGAFIEETLVNSFKEYVSIYQNDDVLFYEEDANTTVSVVEYFSEKDNTKIRSLKVNGKSDASNYFTDNFTQLLLGHIPMLLHKNPTNICVVGLGSGATVATTLFYDTVKNVDVVEISPAVVKAAKNFFTDINYDCLNNPKINLHIEDAKTFLKVIDKKYDVIISEPSNPWIAGIGELFSVEFFEVCKDKLNNNGMLVQWFHTYDMSNESVKLLIETFTSVFKTVTIWKSTEGDIIIIGQKSDFLDVDFNLVTNKISSPKLNQELAKIFIEGPAEFLFRQVISEYTSSTIKGSKRLNSDYFPILEYTAPKELFLNKNADLIINMDERVNNIPNLLLAKYLKNRDLTDKELYNIIVYLTKCEGNSVQLINTYLNKAVNNFKDPNYLYQLAKLIEKHDAIDASIDIYKKLVEIDRKPEYIHSYGNALYKKGVKINNPTAFPYFNQAIQLYTEALNKVNIEKDKYYFNISLSYFRQNRFKEALEYINQAINYREKNKDLMDKKIKSEEIFTQTASIYINLMIKEANTKQKEDYMNKARESLNKALQINPNFEPAKNMLQRFFGSGYPTTLGE